jgi:CDP-glucose 4,6-dehydratase
MYEFKKFQSFWKGKKVFLTGHTGFKGSWFSIVLTLLGAKVAGYSLKPKQKLSFFNLANLKKEIYSSTVGDIRDYNKLKKSIIKFYPDFIVHMAAQSLVQVSYLKPKYTYEVNTIGTLNVLEILNELSFVKSALIITTDKVYHNENKKKYFKENDRLGGSDPYSNSKACSELIVDAYNRSFLKKKKIFVATARAGNVIGGGDFSKNRILPDYFRALKENKILILRSPKSIRPWQHIIEPVYGYLLLLMKMHKRKKVSISGWNFGPNKSNNRSVKDVVDLTNKQFKNSVKIKENDRRIRENYESKVLMLNSNKSVQNLNWKSKYDLNQSIQLTCDWYKRLLNKENILKFSKKQILNYFE